MTLASSPTLNSAGHTRFPTFSMMRTSTASSGSSARPERTMFASRWHSPPKPGSVFTCTSGTWKRASLSASRVVCTSPSRTPRRSLPRISSRVCSSSEVLPAPGELIRLITYVPASSNRSRLAWASASFASRTPSRTTFFTAVRCMWASLRSAASQHACFAAGLSARSGFAFACQHFSYSAPILCRLLLQLERLHVQLFSFEDQKVEASARPALQGKRFGPALRAALATFAPHRYLLYLQIRALDGCSLGDELEAEGERGGYYLAQVAYLQVHLGDLAAGRVAAGDLYHRVGYGELVQAP